MLVLTSSKPNVMLTARRRTVRAPAVDILLVMFLVTLLGARLVLAQESQENPAHWPPNLTLESIHLNGTFGGAEFRSGEWSAQGPIVRYIEASKSGKGTDLVAYDLEKDERFLLVDGDLLCAPDVGRIVDIHGYAFSQDASKVLIFTDPEIAWAGLTENGAQAQGINYEKGVFPWTASGRALSLGRSEGLTKLLFDPTTRRILGAGIVGVNAGDLIAEACLAIEMGCEAEDISLAIHPHPTLSETIAFAAEAFQGTITDLDRPPRK